MSTISITKVTVAGGSGAVGPPIIQALLDAKYEVTVLSRESSSAKFPPDVRVIKTDYSLPSLVEALRGQHAVVSTISTYSLAQQAVLIDAAVEAGVKRFLPSEYGVDSAIPEFGDLGIEPGKVKQDTVAYLRTKEHRGLTWSALIVGAFFDWSFNAFPGLLGFNIPSRRITLYDGGDVPFEATNLAQIGRAVAAILSDKHLEGTTNQYVYVNSCTVTQNQLLKMFEEVSGLKFEVSHATFDDMHKSSLEKINSDPAKGQVWTQGVMEGIFIIMLNYKGLNEYSKHREIWNKRLGLPDEDAMQTIKDVCTSLESSH
jgi:nucleoside-diphosphate-sugar epimerase